MFDATHTQIRAFLRERGIPQAQLAAALGKTPSYVSQVLRGKTPVPDLNVWIAALSLCTGGYVTLDFHLTTYNGDQVREILEITTPPAG